MIDTIIFDGEGVVIDTETIWDWGQEEFLRRRNLVYDREKIKPLLTGKSLIDGVQAMMDEYGFSGDPKELARERKEIVRGLFEHKVTFIDGFREFFDRVSRTCKTCIASAMAEDLLKVVDDRLGLSKLFNGRIFTIADVGYRSKPDPDLFLYAARRLNSEVRNCVVIEDSPLGVEAAKRAGMKCIALTTTYDREKLPGADLVVSSFPEIDLKTCHAKG
jgi:HAD superfamily hydrolase (TIGR01509 family)